VKLLDLPLAIARPWARVAPFLRRLAAPVLFALAVGAAGAALFEMQKEYEDAQVEREMAAESARLSRDFSDQIGRRIDGLGRSAHRWERVRAPLEEEWQADADSLMNQELQFRGVMWLDSTLHPRWLAPPSATLPGLTLDPQGDEVRYRELALIASNEAPSVTRSLVLPDGTRQLLVCAPLYAGERHAGYLVGVIRLRDFIDAVADPAIAQGYSVSIYEGPFLVFGPPWEGNWPQSDWAQDNTFDHDDLALRIQVWPSEELEKRLRSNGPVAILAFSAWIALMVGVLIYRLQRTRERLETIEAAASGDPAAPAAAGEARPLEWVEPPADPPLSGP
jgi:sensor domain CHASE-containing protein